MTTSFASKYNPTHNVAWGVNTTGFTYTKLKEIYNSESDGGADVIHGINAIYLHKSPLGISASFADTANKRMINLPMHLVPSIQAILSDSEAVQAVKDGKVGYTIREYESRGRKCYTIHYVDL